MKPDCRASTKLVPQAIIRNATYTDAQTLAEFNRNLALETENLRLPPAVLRSGVQAVLKDSRRGFYVVAEQSEGENAGPATPKILLASLLVTTEWSDWRNGEFWWIQSVYVVREWRRHGLYRALYQYVKHLAQQRQSQPQNPAVCGFRLYVEQHNQVAQKTYTALGMSETEYKVFAQLSPQTDCKFSTT